MLKHDEHNEGQAPDVVAQGQLAHSHWHISYVTAAGYRVLDNVPFTSQAACERGIAALAWSEGESPKPHAVTAPHCIGGCF